MNFYRLMTKKIDKRYIAESNSIMFNLNRLNIHAAIFFTFGNETVLRN